MCKLNIIASLDIDLVAYIANMKKKHTIYM